MKISLPSSNNELAIASLKAYWSEIAVCLSNAINELDKWIMDRHAIDDHSRLQQLGLARDYLNNGDLVLAYEKAATVACFYSAASVPGLFWYFLAEAGRLLVKLALDERF